MCYNISTKKKGANMEKAIAEIREGAGVKRTAHKPGLSVVKLRAAARK